MEFTKYELLDGANLGGTRCWETNFTGAHLLRANLSASLRGANLSGADLRNADLRGAELISVNMTDAIYNDATVWPSDFDPVAAGALRVEPD
jgi:uncharacterized protein YjbI with pentapeptide repeats